MKISIVVPVYNDVFHIRDCLESIIKQNYTDTEILVFDAGSTDGTLNILREYERYFTFFRSQPDNGQIEVLNLAAKKYATGDVFCWLNSDDMLESGVFKKISVLFRNNGPKILYGNCTWVLEDGTFHPHPCKGDRNFLKILMYWKYHTLPQCSVFMRTSIFKEIGYLNPMYDLAFDYDFWLRCAKRIKNIKYFDQDFSYYRLHPNAKTVKNHAMALTSLRSISQKFIKELPIHNRIICSLSQKFSRSKYLGKNA